MCARPGSPEIRLWSVVRKFARKLSTDVIVLGLEVHTSLAPSRIVTYCACWATAALAWAGPSSILAPATASL